MNDYYSICYWISDEFCDLKTSVNDYSLKETVKIKVTLMIQCVNFEDLSSRFSKYFILYSSVL